MIQNTRIARFAKSLFLWVAVIATSAGWATNAYSQIVNSAAFSKPAEHSIFETADEVPPTETKAAGFSSAPLTKIEQGDSSFDAPAAPLPRMTGVKPLALNSDTLGGDSSGTFAGSNPSKESAENQVSQLQPSHSVNSLRGSSLRPAPEDLTEDQPQRLSSSSVGSFSSHPSPTSTKSKAFASSNTVVTNSTANVFSQTSAQEPTKDQTEEPKFESAYLHDQQPQRDTPVADLFSSPANSHALAPPVEQHKASHVADSFQSNEKHFVQQTAFLSPAAPAQPQFQSNNNQQNNRHFGQRQETQRGQRGQRNQSFQQASQGQRTRQRNLPRQNQSQYQQQSQSQNQQQSQTQKTDSTAAKQTIAKFSFDANQQSAEGLPIRMIDVLQQSAGAASRSQLIPQYWEVYYDWAQSVSAKHHLDWVGSINSAQRNDASSIEIAKSNAQNEITFTAIQLGKSQAKMKSLTGSAQPIVPMDNPTVTRVKTNYEAFKNRGLIDSRFEGIDSTLMQMHELIASRANTVSMAQKNADEAKQLYSRNQSTVDHVLSAGRTWRAAESDFIKSVVEYNKAYADYALALPYGHGPAETVVNMLIVKPKTNQNVSSQAANGRPNLSNDAGSTSFSQNNSSGNDYSIPYSSNQSIQQNGRSAQPRQARQSLPPNSNNRSRGNIRHASTSTGPRPDGPSDRGQVSATSNLMQNARRQETPRPVAQPTSTGFNTAAQPTSTGFNTAAQPTTSGFKTAAQPSTTGFKTAAQPTTSSPAQPSTTGFKTAVQPSKSRANGGVITERSSVGTNYIKRPSQFPANQPAPTASPFSSATSQSKPPSQPAQNSFQARPSTQPPVGDRTAGRPSPFTPATSAGSGTVAPAAKPKPPANAGGFTFGG